LGRLGRGELGKLALHDLNRERQTLQSREGKGRKDRVVPVGDRALTWLERYLDEMRPCLMLRTNELVFSPTAARPSTPS